MPLKNGSTLICTLGKQPQIVTFALDYLLARGEDIKEVVVLHLSQSAEALQRLFPEFDGEQYRGKACRFRAISLRRGDAPLVAIQTEADADAVRAQIHSLIVSLKQQHRALHLSIAGGPRMLALMTLSTALLHCGHQDHVWHMYTQPDFLAQAKAEKLLHDESGNRMWLVEVPIVPWGAYFSALQQSASPTESVRAQTAWLDSTDRRHCKAVWEKLTPRQKEVLRTFAQGHNPQTVAEKLFISIKTVDTHKTIILAHCKSAWALPDKTRLDFHFLKDKFGAFISDYTSAHR